MNKLIIELNELIKSKKLSTYEQIKKWVAEKEYLMRERKEVRTFVITKENKIAKLFEIPEEILTEQPLKYYIQINDYNNNEEFVLRIFNGEELKDIILVKKDNNYLAAKINKTTSITFKKKDEVYIYEREEEHYYELELIGETKKIEELVNNQIFLFGV